MRAYLGTDASGETGMRTPKATLDRADRPALLRAGEVCAALAISTATLYRTPFLMERKVRVGKAGVRWEPATLELYKAIQSRGRAA